MSAAATGPTLVCPNCPKRGPESDFVPAVSPERRHSLGDVYSDVECPDCGALVYPTAAGPGSHGDHNDGMLSRLLCAIQATGALELETIANTMDVSVRTVQAVFERAECTQRQHGPTILKQPPSGDSCSMSPGEALSEDADDGDCYQCSACSGTDIEICLPGWFKANEDLRCVSVDVEADARSYYCNRCEEECVAVNTPNGTVDGGRWGP